MGKDETGLGRRLWFRIEDNNGIKTTVLKPYLTCKPRKTTYYSAYAQQERY